MAKQTGVGAALRRDKPRHNRGVKPFLHSMHASFRRVLTKPVALCRVVRFIFGAKILLAE